MVSRDILDPTHDPVRQDGVLWWPTTRVAGC